MARLRLSDRLKLPLAVRMAKKLPKEKREAFFGLRTRSLSPVVLFPASWPSTRRLVRSFPFSYRSGRTTRVWAQGRFVSVVEGGIGAPSTEITVNLVCKAGAKVVLRIDFCGALSPEIGVGDIFVARAAKSFDQVSRHYSENELVEADKRLVDLFNSVVEPIARQQDVAVHTGTICTVDLFFAQTEQMLREWSRFGEAVDMETSAVFAICQSFGVSSVAAMVVTDNKLAGRHPYSGETESLRRILSGYQVLTEATRLALPGLFALASRGTKAQNPTAPAKQK